jgi:hypothetical protein
VTPQKPLIDLSNMPRMKKCTMCGNEYPISKFTKNSPNKDGYGSWCISCDQEYRKEYNRKHYIENKKANLSRAMKKNYGITMDDKENILENQNYKCPICGIELRLIERKSCVDHDHDTGIIRGVICGNCNIMLGGARDNPDILFSGAKYLVTHKTVAEALLNDEVSQ